MPIVSGRRSGRALLPFAEDRREVQIGRNQADVPVSLQDSHHTGRHAIRHVARLGDGWHQMVVFCREKQGRLANVAEAMTNVELPQQSQAIDVPFASRPRGERDELLHLRAMSVPRMQPERRQVSHERHGTPGQHRKAGDGEPQSDLRREVGERVQDDQRPHAVRVVEGEGQRNGPAERFADDGGTMFDRCGSVHNMCKISGKKVEALGIVSQRVRGDAIGLLEERYLSVEEISGSVHAGHEDNRASLATNRQPGVVVATHWRRP